MAPQQNTRSRLGQLARQLQGANLAGLPQDAAARPAGHGAAARAAPAAAARGERLAGKTAVVTGGGTGIGAAIAVALHGEGCSVVVCGRRAEPIERLANLLGAGSRAAVLDVVDEPAVAAFFAAAGRVDILVNNAGTNIVEREFERLSPADFTKVLEINTVGCFNCLHHAVPMMAAVQVQQRAHVLSLQCTYQGL
jgi:NADP-dependent 3-hydroxy acid dehydrogenase YdfG